MFGDLTGKTIVIFGGRGCGKTTLAKSILKEQTAGFVYDTLREYNKKAYNVFIPAFRDSSKLCILELEKFGRKLLLPAIRKQKISFFLVDEANRYAPSQKPLTPLLQNLNDWCRHPPYRVGMGFICRRPAQLNTSITELANYLICFKLTGRNDLNFIEEIDQELSEKVRSLNEHEFTVFDGKSIKTMKLKFPQANEKEEPAPTR